MDDLDIQDDEHGVTVALEGERLVMTTGVLAQELEAFYYIQ